MVIGDDNYLIPGSSTSSNKGPMDKHVHTQALTENKGKGEKVQTTLNQHWKKKAREEACELKQFLKTRYHLTLLILSLGDKCWKRLESVGRA